MYKQFFIVALLAASSLYAQPSLTTVSSTVTTGDGTLFTGKITIVRPAHPVRNGGRVIPSLVPFVRLSFDQATFDRHDRIAIQSGCSHAQDGGWSARSTACPSKTSGWK